MKSTMSILCSEVIRNAENNRISIYNIIEEIYAKSYPITVPQIGFLVILEREKGDRTNFHLRLKVFNNDEILFEELFESKFETPTPRVRNIIHLTGVKIEDEGHLRFELSYGRNVLVDHIVGCRIV